MEQKYAGSVLQYIHEFNLKVSKLQAMSIKFDERLLIALLLRGLPGEYEVFRSTVWHRDKVPTLDELFAMVKVEAKILERKPSEAHAALTANPSPVTNCSVPGCRRNGHTRDQCWVLHPELAPVCTNCNGVGHVARLCRRVITPQTNLAQMQSFDEFQPLSL